MPIFALTLDLKDDQRLVLEYLEHHRRIWPEVLGALEATGVQDIKIYLAGRRLFMAMTAPEGFDPEVSFAEYRKNPVAERWDDLMKTYQQKVPEAGADQWWMPLSPVFDFSAAIKARDARVTGAD
jgi:L-rhamnose mutarotase